LPTSYQRDLQEDKEALFSAHDQVADMVVIAAGAVSTTQFRDEKLRSLASNPSLLATEAADYLVRKGIPFRQAHDLIGKILREAEKQGKNWIELPIAELQKISPEIGSDFAKNLTVETALAAKSVPGGTSPDSVRAAIADLEKRIRGIGAAQ
jgi:argininosuccinate lyase